MRIFKGRKSRHSAGLAVLLVAVMMLPQGAQAALADVATPDVDTNDIAIVKSASPLETQETTDSDAQVDEVSAEVAQAGELTPATSSEGNSRNDVAQGETGNPEYDSQTEAAQGETGASVDSSELENSGGGGTGR